MQTEAQTQTATSRQRPEHILRLSQSFVRSLLADGKAQESIKVYMTGVLGLASFLDAEGMPTSLPAIAREHIEQYFIHLRSRRPPYASWTLNKHYKGLRLFFKWALEEGEIQASPMERMKPPRITEKQVPVLSQDALRALVKACEGRDFYARRDMAIVRLLIDTGMRRAEIAGLTLADVDLTTNQATVTGKGSRRRTVPFGRKSAVALDRWLRVRDDHADAEVTSAFWLGLQGPLGVWGIGTVIERRAKQAGLKGVHVHLFRHAAAHYWLAEGGQEGDLMSLMGWRSRSMCSLYAASAAASRAREAHRKLSMGDRL